MLERVMRTASVLRKQRTQGFETPTAPHFDDETLARFKSELENAGLYVEYGSGGSTILADQMRVRTISVESDPYYARAVERGLSPDTTVRMIVPNMGLTEDWGWPVFNVGDKGLRYARAPLMGEFPNLVLVDGRYRVLCALEAARIAHVRGQSATLIFDDYADKPHYHAASLLGGPEMVGRSAVFEIGRTLVSSDAVSRFVKDPR